MRTSGLLLFICAGLLLSGGTLLGGTAAWSLARMSYYFWTTELGVELGGAALLLGGGLLCLPACWLATLVPNQPRSTLTLALMTLSSAALLSLAAGVSSSASLSRALREPAAINASMLRALSYATFDPAVSSAFSAMQIDLKCCGVHSPADWYQHRSSLPSACCGKVWDGKRTEPCTSGFAPGCLRIVLWDLKNFNNTVTVLAAALIIVLAVTLFLAAYSLVSELAEQGAARAKQHALCVACIPSPTPSALLRPACFPATVTQV